MDQAFVKVMISEAVRIATLPFRIMPIKRNRIVFTGLTGGKNYDYSCNPRYVYEYLRDKYPGWFEYVWAVSDKNKYAFLEEEGVKLVKHFTVSSFPMLLTAKVIVTNGSYAPWFPFRKKQYVINTWHGGGAYKKVENDRPDANWATKKRARFCAENIDLFVASCKVQEENMIQKTFLYHGDVLRAGTPRNDKLVRQETEEFQRKVKERYGIPDNGKIVLYAPTYRMPSMPVVLESDRLLQKLNGGLLNGTHEGERWFFMCRYHRYQEGAGLQILGENIIDVSDYPDMQELLCAADMLLTDYSSCIWDYSFLKRPCFLYVPDKEEYIQNTGFYVGMEQWPYKQAKTMEELEEDIAQYDDGWQLEQIQKHWTLLGNYEQGRCCEQLTDKILEQTENNI